jgi:hypothetical protein
VIVVAEAWQLRFDGGHQQRYLPDRRAVLRYVLSISGHSPDPRFEVWHEDAGEAVPGRTFTLVEVLDLGRPGERARILAELRQEA